MIRLGVGVILGAIIVVFAVQNPEIVSFNFISWTVTVNKALLVIVVFIIGILFGWIIGTIGRSRRSRRA